MSTHKTLISSFLSGSLYLKFRKTNTTEESRRTRAETEEPAHHTEEALKSVGHGGLGDPLRALLKLKFPFLMSRCLEVHSFTFPSVPSLGSWLGPRFFLVLWPLEIPVQYPWDGGLAAVLENADQLWWNLLGTCSLTKLTEEPEAAWHTEFLYFINIICLRVLPYLLTLASVF